MDQVYVVRHKVKVEGLSAREVARQLGISRNTVRRYVEGADPGQRQERPGGPQARLDSLRQRLGALLTESPQWKRAAPSPRPPDSNGHLPRRRLAFDHAARRT